MTPADAFPETALRLMRTCFDMPQDDAVRSAELLGAGAFRFLASGDQAVAMLATWRTAQWFGGRPVAAAPVAFVAVAPSERRKGCADRLLRRTLAELREEGAALSVLYAAVSRPYVRVGYARAGVTRRVSCPPFCFGAADAAAMTPFAFDGDAALLASARREELRRTNGGMERDEILWTLLLRDGDAPATDCFGRFTPAGLEGYLALAAPRDGRLKIVDACLPTARAAAAAMALLAGLSENGRGSVDVVEWRAGPDDLMFHMLAENAHSVEAEDEWMLRVVDVPAALAQRGYPQGVAASIALQIEDDALPENGGVWRLSVNDGIGFVEKEKNNCRPDAIMPVSALAPLFSGYVNAENLTRMKKIKAANAAITKMNSIFSVPYPHMSDNF